MNPTWSSVVKDSLDEAILKYPDRAIPGAPFSQILKRQAHANNLEFPPPPFKSFRSFIKTFKGVLLVQDRPGRDILIVPVDRVDLLSSDAPESTPNVIRKDIFNALTQINNRSNADPYYVRETDQVIWIEPDQPEPEGLVPFEKATFENEILDRQAFIASSAEPLSHEAKAMLSIALQSASPLGAFSNAIRSLELGNAWHRSRMGAVLKRLQRWSVENDVEWNSSWVSESSVKVKEIPLAENIPAAPPDMTVAVFGRSFFTALAEIATDDDLSRIVVPLDLVAKVWNSKIR